MNWFCVLFFSSALFCPFWFIRAHLSPAAVKFRRRIRTISRQFGYKKMFSFIKPWLWRWTELNARMRKSPLDFMHLLLIFPSSLSLFSMELNSNLSSRSFKPQSSITKSYFNFAYRYPIRRTKLFQHMVLHFALPLCPSSAVFRLNLFRNEFWLHQQMLAAAYFGSNRARFWKKKKKATDQTPTMSTPTAQTTLGCAVNTADVLNIWCSVEIIHMTVLCSSEKREWEKEAHKKSVTIPFHGLPRWSQNKLHSIDSKQIAIILLHIST